MLNLNKLDAFKNLKKILENNSASTNICNLLAYKDQMLYVWNQDECCLYTILLTTAHEDHPLYQVTDDIYLNYGTSFFLYHYFRYYQIIRIL